MTDADIIRLAGENLLIVYRGEDGRIYTDDDHGLDCTNEILAFARALLAAQADDARDAARWRAGREHGYPEHDGHADRWYMTSVWEGGRPVVFSSPEEAMDAAIAGTAYRAAQPAAEAKGGPA